MDVPRVEPCLSKRGRGSGNRRAGGAGTRRGPVDRGVSGPRLPTPDVPPPGGKVPVDRIRPRRERGRAGIGNVRVKRKDAAIGSPGDIFALLPGDAPRGFPPAAGFEPPEAQPGIGGLDQKQDGFDPLQAVGNESTVLVVSDGGSDTERVSPPRMHMERGGGGGASPVDCPLFFDHGDLRPVLPAIRRPEKFPLVVSVNLRPEDVRGCGIRRE